ncbi:hypothetical protein ACFRAU_10010 [Arthrobacter sp. NPDC056691]|uniref:hypothetical protein n=1 Tax=Arthrobacter sp. NPDC056691 TaxID=3345913 RepID=UPI0036734F9D
MGSLLAFMAWHKEHGTTSDPVPVLADMMAFFPVYADISGGAALTAMDPALIAQKLDSLEERDPEFSASFSSSLHEYVHFLGQTGRWSGTLESLGVLHGVLYHGMFNEKFSSAGWPRTRADGGQHGSRKSA